MTAWMSESQSGRSHVLKVDGTENGRFLKATYFRHWKFQFGTVQYWSIQFHTNWGSKISIVHSHELSIFDNDRAFEIWPTDMSTIFGL